MIDRNGVVVGHSRRSDPGVGQPVSAGLRERIALSPEGFTNAAIVGGKTVEFAHVRSDLTGWTLGVTVQKSVLEAPLRAALMQIAAGGLPPANRRRVQSPRSANAARAAGRASAAACQARIPGLSASASGLNRR